MPFKAVFPPGAGPTLAPYSPGTTAEELVRVCEIGHAAGLHYVYAGNLPGSVGRWENTWCPTCSALLVERFGYRIRKYRITDQGTCPDCATRIAGIWS